MTCDAVRRHAGTAGYLAVVVLTAVSSGCSGQPSHDRAGHAVAGRTTATGGHAAAHVPWTDPARSLKGPNAKVVLSTGRRTGGLTLTVARIAAGGVWVATECQGTGTLTVNADVHGVYREPCGPSPDSTLNENDTLGPSPAGRLTITADPGVTWSVALGWSHQASR